MSAPQIDLVYPLAWPPGRPRTPPHRQKGSAFRHDGRALDVDEALRRLQEQTDLVTRIGEDWRMRELTLSTNCELRADGRPRRDRREPGDPGAAFFFELDGEPTVLASDRFLTVACNIAAIAATIEAQRGIERWGVSTLKEAFTGHAALPAPEQWGQVLGLTSAAPAELITRRYHELARDAHPDTGGSEAAMARLNAARDEGLKARGKP